MCKDRKEFALSLINSHFCIMEKRVLFLGELYNTGHKDEAVMLCCCYIESFGNGKYGKENRNKRNFVQILKEYGNNEVINSIHPYQLKLKISECRKITDKSAIDNFCDTLRSEKKLYTEQEILELGKVSLNRSDVTILSKNLWRGTVAAIAYEEIRNYAVHDLGAINNSFAEYKFKDMPVPNLDFTMLYTPLQDIFKAMRKFSLKTGELCGRLDVTKVNWNK